MLTGTTCVSERSTASVLEYRKRKPSPLELVSVNGNTSEGETYVTNILKGKPEERILRNLVTNTLEGKADVTNTLKRKADVSNT